MRKAVRIDQEPEGEEDGARWAERLPAMAASDPLVSLLLHESALDEEKILAAS